MDLTGKWNIDNRLNNYLTIWAAGLRTNQKVPVLAVLAVFMLLGSIAAVVQMSSVHAQTAPNCAANTILHLTYVYGVPTNFNALLPFNSGFSAVYLAYKAVYPAILADGSLASDFSMATTTHNADSTVWVFHVIPGETWSDGTPVTAQDIVNTYSKGFALNPAFDPIGASSFITSVTANGTDTAVMTLNSSQPHLPELLSPPLDTSVYPQSFTSQGANYTGFNAILPADGPFYIYNYKSGSSNLIMYRNPYYKPVPAVCEIVWNFVETTAQTPTYLEAGTTDVALIDWSSVSSLATNPAIKIIQSPGGYFSALWYNYMKYPWNTTQFRQAMAYSVNESQIIQKAFAGYGTTGEDGAANVPSYSSFYNQNQMKYSYSPTQALKLLGQIGITKGSDGFLQYPNGTDISLTEWVDNTFSANVIAGQIVQTDLQSLGFKITSNVVASAVISSYAASNQHAAWTGRSFYVYTDFGLTLGSQFLQGLPYYDWWGVLPAPPSNTEMMPPSANSSFWSNETAFMSTNSPALESQYFANIQALRAQYLPFIPLGFEPYLFGVNTQRFTGWPSTNLAYPDGVDWNMTAFAVLQPTSAVSTTQSTSTAAAPAAGIPLWQIAAVLIIAVVIIAVVAVSLSRRRPTKPPSTP